MESLFSIEDGIQTLVEESHTEVVLLEKAVEVVKPMVSYLCLCVVLGVIEHLLLLFKSDVDLTNIILFLLSLLLRYFVCFDPVLVQLDSRVAILLDAVLHLAELLHLVWRQTLPHNIEQGKLTDTLENQIDEFNVAC